MGKKKGSGGRGRGEGGPARDESGHKRDQGGRGRGEGGPGRGEGGPGRGEGGPGRGEGGPGRGEGGPGRDESGHRTDQGGRGRGEGGPGRDESGHRTDQGGRGRGEGGRGRGEGGRGRGEGGRGRGEGGRGRGEGGRGRGEGERGRGWGERGRGEGRPGIDVGGRGRGEGEPVIDVGGSREGEGGSGRGEGRRGRGWGERGRGEGRPGIDVGGRGRGEGEPVIDVGGSREGEGGSGRGEGRRGRGWGERGRGEGRPRIYVGGRGRGEGEPVIDVGGSREGEGGSGRGEGRRGRGWGERGRGKGRPGIDVGGHGRDEGELGGHDIEHGIGKIDLGGGDIGDVKDIEKKVVGPSVPKQPKEKREETAQTSQLSVQVTTTQKPSASPEKTQKISLPSTVAGQLALSIPTRTNPNICGTMGRRIMVEVNVMSLELNNLKTAVSQYDVTITADPPTSMVPKFLMRPVFEAFREKFFSHRFPAFDGRKIAYSSNDLPFGRSIQDEVTIFDRERQQERTFRVEMTKCANLDLSFLKNVRPGFQESLGCQSGIQALDVILRHGPLSYHIPVGRSIFWNDGRSQPLPNGLELWVGAFSSAILGWKPLLNIDVAHKGFPKAQGVIELMKELCGVERDITAEDVYRKQREIDKYLKTLKVHYEIPNIPSSKRTQGVNGLVECPRKNSFSRDDGNTCTIEEYFRIEKRYTIRYPFIPCLWVGSKNKKIYVPPELCKIVAGQVTQKKMDDKQTREMIRFAATSTIKRKQKIMDGFRALRLNDYPTMRNEFNLAVRAEFEKVPARVLDPPKLEYNNRSTVPVIKGTWRAKQFLDASVLGDNTWTILNLGGRYLKDRDMYSLRDGLISGATSVGMSIGKPFTPFRSLINDRRDRRGVDYQVKEVLEYFNEMKKQGLRLVIVIIPENDADAYSTVKQVTELKVGVLTQCIKSGTLERKMNSATIGNILLKINSKLNGINHKIPNDIRPPCLREPCILIGADVTHPSPDAQNIPSIAAVAASFDPTGFKYNIEIRLQPARKEIIDDLTEIIYRQFVFFRAKTNHVPRRVIFYRDGVSEGQLTQVMHYEISAIRKAFRKLSPDGSYCPPITFLVVQKRHHIRFFPTSQENSDDRNFNVQAGTIVDTHITHPSHIDFYLVSHASIQGTARPTKYKCICNECNMTEDEIEQLTYYLCHMFSRCTRSVSYPAPTYYAHLAAFRARALIQNIPIRMDKLDDEQKKVTVIMSDSPMFYV